MSDPTASPTPSPVPMEPRTWQVGAAARLFHSFLFLLLLPFYVSIGPMLFQRLSRGFVLPAVTLALFGLAFSVVMALIFSRLLQAVRSRVELTDRSLDLVLPAITRGPFTLFRFVNKRIPLADIKAVETRAEVYGGGWAPVMLRSTRVVTNDGAGTVLGYADAHDGASAIPFNEIGQAVAARIGKPVVDYGAVHRSIQKRMAGTASSADENIAITPNDIVLINTTHRRNVLAGVVGIGMLVIAGIAIDVWTASDATFARLTSPAAQTEAPARKK